MILDTFIFYITFSYKRFNRFFLFISFIKFELYYKRFERFFNKTNNEKTFSPKDRILLTYSLLSRTPYSNMIQEDDENRFTLCYDDLSQRIGIDRAISEDIFVSAFPLHDVNKDLKLKKRKKN